MLISSLNTRRPALLHHHHSILDLLRDSFAPPPLRCTTTLLHRCRASSSSHGSANCSFNTQFIFYLWICGLIELVGGWGFLSIILNWNKNITSITCLFNKILLYVSVFFKPINHNLKEEKRKGDLILSDRSNYRHHSYGRNKEEEEEETISSYI